MLTIISFHFDVWFRLYSKMAVMLPMTATKMKYPVNTFH